ncbi:MAG: hypothetical protein K1060chlam5_00725 [Candidatus Anoxychlamydiales bacterium]|nr:hypothetical protein [Candidatus Anoxychlamydiales bacterium]
MEWLYIYLPFADINVFIPALLLIGFSVGVISSFFGIGGAWMVTPGLNILGFPMAYAIGTDMAHIAGKSVFATIQHSKFGNVDYKLGFVMLLGTIAGIEGGAQVIMHLEKLFIINTVVRWVYAIFLLIIALVMFYDYFKQKNSKDSKQGIQWYKKFQKLPIPPFVHFKVANVTCSLWLPVIVGLITGFLAGFLGIGGGLFRLPALIYCVGCPVIVAVGTDLFEVMISGFYGGFSYSMKGRVDFIAVGIMLLGAVLGTRIGAVATKYVDSSKIRMSFATAVLGCFVSILLKIFNYKISSAILIFSTIGLICLQIIYIFIKNHLLKKKAVKYQ